MENNEKRRFSKKQKIVGSLLAVSGVGLIGTGVTIGVLAKNKNDKIENSDGNNPNKPIEPETPEQNKTPKFDVNKNENLSAINDEGNVFVLFGKNLNNFKEEKFRIVEENEKNVLWKVNNLENNKINIKLLEKINKSKVLSCWYEDEKIGSLNYVFNEITTENPEIEVPTWEKELEIIKYDVGVSNTMFINKEWKKEVNEQIIKRDSVLEETIQLKRNKENEIVFAVNCENWDKWENFLNFYEISKNVNDYFLIDDFVEIRGFEKPQNIVINEKAEIEWTKNYVVLLNVVDENGKYNWKATENIKKNEYENYLKKQNVNEKVNLINGIRFININNKQNNKYKCIDIPFKISTTNKKYNINSLKYIETVNARKMWFPEQIFLENKPWIFNNNRIVKSVKQEGGDGFVFGVDKEGLEEYKYNFLSSDTVRHVMNEIPFSLNVNDYISQKNLDELSYPKPINSKWIINNKKEVSENYVIEVGIFENNGMLNYYNLSEIDWLGLGMFEKTIFNDKYLKKYLIGDGILPFYGIRIFPKNKDIDIAYCAPITIFMEEV